jgi:monoamine oxidase
VLLRNPVGRIVQSPGSVHVYSKRYDIRAKQAIVAVPPVIAGQIRWSPAMPAARQELTHRAPQGHLIKAEAVYETPFWRDDGLTGTAVSPDTLPCQVTFDNSPPEGKPGVVFGFIGGDAARDFASRPADVRRKAVLDNFVKYFGPKAANPIDYFEMDWSKEQWTQGCPVATMPPGVLTKYGKALREPVGRIHWAGTESSDYWCGYMDGAVRSGERAAREVLAAL